MTIAFSGPSYLIARRLGIARLLDRHIAFLVLGLGVQRASSADMLQSLAWSTFFLTLTPAFVFYAFSTITFDRRLALALVAVVLAAYLTIAVRYGYAALVSSYWRNAWK